MRFLAENLQLDKSAGIAFDKSNTLWAKPNPLLQAERASTQDKKSCMFALFSVSEVFANAKVKLCDTQ